MTIIGIQAEFTSAPLDLLAPHRLFVRRGTLTKKCRSRDEPYEFILFNDILLYASVQTGRGGLKLHQTLRIDEHFAVSEIQDLPTQFRFQVRLGAFLESRELLDVAMFGFVFHSVHGLVNRVALLVSFRSFSLTILFCPASLYPPRPGRLEHQVLHCVHGHQGQQGRLVARPAGADRRTPPEHHVAPRVRLVAAEQHAGPRSSRQLSQQLFVRRYRRCGRRSDRVVVLKARVAAGPDVQSVFFVQ